MTQKQGIRNSECTACKYHKFSLENGSDVCLINEEDSGSFFVVLDRIPRYCYNSGEIILRREWHTIRQVLESFDVEWSDVYVTSLLKCFTEFGGNYSGQTTVPEFDVCPEIYLKSEIAKHRPRVILAVGDKAMHYFFGDVIIEKSRKMNVEYEGVKVVACETPDVLVRADGKVNEQKLRLFSADVMKAVRVHKGLASDKSVYDFTKTQVITTQEELLPHLERIKNIGYVAFDVETSSLDFTTGYITTIGLSYAHGGAIAMPLYHKDSPLNREEVGAMIDMLNAYVFNNPDVAKCAWNIKFDMKMMWRAGFRIRGRLLDGMLMCFLLEENNFSYKLEDISKHYYPEVEGYKIDVKEYGGWENVPLELLYIYNGMDADVTLRLCNYFEGKLQEFPPLYRNSRSINAPACYTLAEAEYEGLYVNKAVLDMNYETLMSKIDSMKTSMANHKVVYRYYLARVEERKLAEIETRTKKIEASLAKDSTKNGHHRARWEDEVRKIKAGEISYEVEVNFSSPQQMAEIFYTHPKGFKFKPLKFRGEVSYSTDEETIKSLTDKTGFLDMLLAYRGLSKLASTYLNGVREVLDNEGRVHPTFNLNGTKTGRLSATNPNTQNMPRASDPNSGLIKVMFEVPSPDYTLVQVDFSQMELRLAALASGDATMIEAYANKVDLHAFTYQNVADISPDTWALMSKEERKAGRQIGKPTNFGLIYGMAWMAFKDLAKNQYGIILTDDEAQNIHSKFFALYPGLVQWHIDSIQKARENGYVETFFGRRRRLYDIHSDNNTRRSEAERQAINSPIQGTGAEYTIFCANILRLRLPKSVIFVNTVHDSLMYYVLKKELAEIVPLMVDVCENAPVEKYFGISFDPVGLKVDVEAGENWRDLKEYVL